MTEAGVRLCDGAQRGQLTRSVVADADQDAGGEGDGERPGRFEGGQPTGRLLVGRVAMRVEVGGQRLDLAETGRSWASSSR
jgi:hypothetical protein